MEVKVLVEGKGLGAKECDELKLTMDWNGNEEVRESLTGRTGVGKSSRMSSSSISRNVGKEVNEARRVIEGVGGISPSSNSSDDMGLEVDKGQ